MAGSRFLQMFSGFVGMAMVAHLGKQVLAASALISASLTTSLLIFLAILFAVSFVVGQTVGAKQYQDVGALVQQSLLLSLVLGAAMTVLFWFVPDIVGLFRQSPALVDYVTQYFHALSWGAIPILLQACVQQFMYGILKQRVVIFVNFITLIIGVCLSYGLIFGFWLIPPLGIAGLAYAFVVQSWAGFFIILAVCYFKKEYQQYALFSYHNHANLFYMRKVFQVGWPMSVQFGGELLAFFVIAMMIGWLGTDSLAAVQITQQWLFLVIVPIFAMSEASGILVGRAVGAEQFDELKKIGQASFLVVFVLVAVLGLFFIFFPHHFAGLYLNTSEVNNHHLLRLVQILFVILVATLLLNAFRDVTSGLLRGLYDTQYPMRVGLMVMWGLVLPIGYVMAFPLNWGVIGFRAGGNIGMLIGALVIYCRWQKKVKEFSR